MPTILALALACRDPIPLDTEPQTSVWHADVDGDGFGAVAGVEAVTAPAGHVADGSDCDDADAAVHPGATEVCNGHDDDCDTLSDEAGSTGELAWYPDVDADGYGAADGTPISACTYAGFAANALDCDDARDDINPDQVERCDAADVDEDCDGLADDADDALDPRTRVLLYPDADHDGFGDPSTPTWACDPSDLLLADASDCDDDDAAVHPGAVERCNGVEDDCDPATPDREPGTVLFRRWDGVDFDVTAAWTGAAAAPAEVTTTDPGAYWVCEGTWYATVRALHDVAILGVTADETVLDAAGSGTVVEVQGTDVTLADVTLTGGEGDVDVYTSGMGTDGGGVAVYGGSVAAMRVVIADNDAMYGAGIAVGGIAEVTLVDCEVRDNFADAWGGGLFVETSGLSVEGTVVSGNQAGLGGGLYATKAVDVLHLTDSLFSANAATQGAGAWLGSGVYDCEGTAGAAAGFHANLRVAAVYVGSPSSTSFKATVCDFGEPATADDNAKDVSFGGKDYVYGDDASFSCGATGCK